MFGTIVLGIVLGCRFVALLTMSLAVFPRVRYLLPSNLLFDIGQVHEYCQTFSGVRLFGVRIVTPYTVPLHTQFPQFPYTVPLHSSKCSQLVLYSFRKSSRGEVKNESRWAFTRLLSSLYIISDIFVVELVFFAVEVCGSSIIGCRVMAHIPKSGSVVALCGALCGVCKQ